MRKILVSLLALTLVAASANSVLAKGYGQFSGGNSGWTTNIVTAFSNTGGNGIANSSNESGCGGSSRARNNDGNQIVTGNANAHAEALNVVNSNVDEGGCCGPDYQDSWWNYESGADNYVYAGANTGENGIANSSNSSGYGGSSSARGNDSNVVRTGNANAHAEALNVVNSNVDEGGCCGPDYQESWRNRGYVYNDVYAGANTGENGIANSSNSSGYGGSSARNNDGNVVVTGNANASASAVTVLNSNISRSFVR